MSYLSNSSILPTPQINRFQKLEATYIQLYKLSGADKNIGTVINIAQYLLGQSCSDHDVDITAQKEFLFFQDNVFGGQKHARIGLRMIPAFYHRDYALVRDIYLEGQEGAAKNKITAALNKHEQTGSFPTGRPFSEQIRIYLLIFNYS